MNSPQNMQKDAKTGFLFRVFSVFCGLFSYPSAYSR